MKQRVNIVKGSEYFPYSLCICMCVAEEVVETLLVSFKISSNKHENRFVTQFPLKMV